MDAFRSLHDRIDRVSDRVARRPGDSGAVEEMNDVLSEGYAAALQAEARLIRLEQRLAERIAVVDELRAGEVRTLARELRRSEQAVLRLREHLAAAHDRLLAVRDLRVG